MDLEKYKGNLTINRYIEVHGDYHEHRGADNQPTIPDVLRQEDAQALLLKAQSAGLLDENLQPTTPKSEAALLAFVIASKLHLPQQWSPFEDLWSIKELRGHYNKAIETAKSRQILTNLELLFQ